MLSDSFTFYIGNFTLEIQTAKCKTPNVKCKSYTPASSSLRMRRIIFPTLLFGKSDLNSMCLGTL